jgi:hypothetical protein
MKILLSSRRHHYVTRLSIFLITMILIAGMASSCQPSPSETVEIQNWYDLDVVRNNLVGNYVLMENLDDTTDGYDELVGDTVDGKGWQPIGTEGNAFKGTFDGNGHTISDLFIDRPDEDEVGLFGRVQEGLVKNIGLLGVDVTGKKYVGALVGYSWKGTIDSDIRPPGSKTYSRGSVTGEENVGGLVGNNYDGTVNQCESSAEVFHASSAPDEDCWRTGGLVGLNSGTVLNCDYNGVVNGDRQVGGLVGLNAALLTIRGQVEDCGGQYSVNGNLEVGGVAGRNIGNIRRASFTGDVNGITIGDGLVALNEDATVNAYASDTALQGSYVGGVVGVNEGTVEDCSAEATVKGYQYVGGLAGTNNGTVEKCSADSKVTGDSNVGGLVGENQGTLDNCSSCGEVTGDSSTGCLVGHNIGTVNNSGSTSWVTGTSDGGDLVGWNEGVISGIGYVLRVASTSGGSVPSPGEGTFAYNEDEVISLVATPDTGNRFVIWTAKAGTFANPNTATTTFTMPSQDVTVTAHFVGPVDHFNYYLAEDERGYIPVGEVVYLEDQFCAVQAEVGYAVGFCDPVEKQHDGVTPISNPDHHLTMYSLDYEEEPQAWYVSVDNQFGTQQELIVSGPVGLAVPTQKESHEPPVGLDHFLLYGVIEGPTANPSVNVVVGLNDQFGYEWEVLVTTPIFIGIPVQKTHGGVVMEIEDSETHLVFYEVEWGEFETKVQVVNQFGPQTLDIGGPYLLAVPSKKGSAYPALPPVE